jgi:hypothetical protein
LTIKKEDFCLEFKSKDKAIVEKELAVWITSAAELFEQTFEQNPEPVKEAAAEKIELGNINLDIQKPVEKPVEAAPKEDFPVVEEKTQSYKISDETKEILQKAIHKPMQSMDEMLRPTPKMPSQPAPQSIPQPVVQTVKTPEPEPEVVVYQEQQDFTTIYNQKIAQENSSTDRFAQLLSLSTIHNKFDCLIACAYHLVERENFERFTLKQINTLSKALLEELIEHDTLKEALEKRFIKIVPDYTGIATTMEYTLTDQGAEYFKDVISER